MDNSYLPVPYEFREVLEAARVEGISGPIHFFSADDQIFTATGKIKEVIEKPGKGEFVVLDSEEEVRLDTIITLYGKPGPSFDTYDAFANACLSCTGGYDL
ncbi:MAG: hypothetical protein ACK4ND_12575 [Cytophagaceae bacterium]